MYVTVCISCYLNFANGAYLIQLTDLFFAASSVIMYLSITFNPIFLKIIFLTVSIFVLLKCCKKYFLMTTNVTSTLVLYLVVSVYFICQIQHNFSLQHSRIAICLSRCLFYIYNSVVGSYSCSLFVRKCNRGIDQHFMLLC